MTQRNKHRCFTPNSNNTSLSLVVLCHLEPSDEGGMNPLFGEKGSVQGIFASGRFYRRRDVKRLRMRHPRGWGLRASPRSRRHAAWAPRASPPRVLLAPDTTCKVSHRVIFWVFSDDFSLRDFLKLKNSRTTMAVGTGLIG